MSHFTRLRTRIVSQPALVRALADLGYKEVEVHDDPQTLYGYRGDAREQRAQVIIRRENVGSASNDIGFEKVSDGTYRAWISEYDRSEHDSRWLQALHGRYAYHATRETMASQGFNLVSEEQGEDGNIRLTLRRMT